MTRKTRHFNIAVPVANSILILDRNDNRAEYSFQNMEPAGGNFVCFGADPQVTCPAIGAEDHNTGQRIVPAQFLSDDIDTDRVYARANTLAVNVSVVEITVLKDKPKPKPDPRRIDRAERTQPRRGTRSIG